MATAAQITANQQNAQSSTGPQSPEGKAAASRNAATHGLHAVNPVLPHESQAEFDALHASYRSELQPKGLREDFLVRQVAEAQWRLVRLQKIEAEFIDILAAGQARQNPNAAIAASMLEKGGPDALSRLHRLAASAERAYHRNYNALIRERRDQSRERAREEGREHGRQLLAAAESYIFAPVPGPKRQNEPNRRVGSPVLHPAHKRNEANRDSLALRL
jgi:hypothetical protein